MTLLHVNLSDIELFIFVLWKWINVIYNAYIKKIDILV